MVAMQSEEMQFLKKLFQSLDQRHSAYEKIRNSEAEIDWASRSKMRTIDPSYY